MEIVMKNIPKNSIFYVPVGNTLPVKSELDKHENIVIASMTNNDKILSLPDEQFDSKWIFSKEDMSDDFYSGYLSTHILLIPEKVMQNYTNIKTCQILEENSEEKVLVCVIPMIINNGDISIRKLIKDILLAGYLSLNVIPDFMNLNNTIKAITSENRKFWEKFKPDSEKLSKYFMNRRFRNDNFIETEDYASIKGIKQPVKIEAYSFMNVPTNPNNQDPTTANDSDNQENLKETWDGTEWKDDLRNAMGIKPLDLLDYEMFATQDEVEEVFRVASRLADGDRLVFELYSIFLKSYFCCHLIFRSEYLMKKLNKLMTPKINYNNYYNNNYYNNNNNRKKLSGVHLEELNRSLMYGLHVLYTEEILLGGNLTLEHRSVWKYNTAHLLPIYQGANIYHTPYLCIPISRSSLHLDSNLLGLTSYDLQSTTRLYNGTAEPINRSLLGRLNDSPKGFIESVTNKGYIRGILEPNDVLRHKQIFTNGIFDDLEDPEIFLTGSGGEACLYDNPLFRKNRYSIGNIYPERDVIGLSGERINTHAHSDIDLVVFTNDESVLKMKAESILKCLQEHYYVNITTNKKNENDIFEYSNKTFFRSRMTKPIAIEMIKVNDSKYRFTSPLMEREIDIFMSNRNPASLLYNYHIPTCRVLIPLSNEISIIKNKTIMMQSMVLSAHLGFCIDRRWFSSKISLYDRILRQFSRGIGMLLNVYELQMVKDYIDNSDKWKHLSNIITVIQTQDVDASSGIITTRSHIKVMLPGYSGNFFSTENFHVGQYFKKAQDIISPDIDQTTLNHILRTQHRTPYKLKDNDGNFIFSTPKQRIIK
jgi:hypothetical protein